TNRNPFKRPQVIALHREQGVRIAFELQPLREFRQAYIRQFERTDRESQQLMRGDLLNRSRMIFAGVHPERKLRQGIYDEPVARHQLPCISDKEVELVRFQQPEQVPPMSNFDTSPNSRMIARDARKNRLNQYRSGDRSQP